MKFFTNHLFIFFFPLIVLLVILLANIIPPIVWGYDEFGAIVSHLELDNPAYTDIYREYLVNFGITNPTILEFIITNIFPIIVVPVRWTYAIGISPILGVSRLIDIDWPLLGTFLLIPYIFFAMLGTYLVSLSVVPDERHQNVIFFFLSFILLSHPFLKWTLTLTSYSHHLFCFGLLLYSEVKLKPDNKMLSKAAFSRSVVQVFNYQYIVIVAILGLFELIRNFRSFFKEKIYLNWVLPGIVAIISVCFLVLRGLVSGKHSNPAYTGNTEIYDFANNIDGLFSSLGYLISRLVDFLYYYFIQTESYYGGPNNSEISFLGVTLFILACIFIYLNYWKKINTKLKRTLLIFIIALLVPYLLSIQPFMATRHSLVLLLPLALIFSFTICIFLESFFAKKYVTLASILLLMFSAYNAIGFNKDRSENLNIEKIAPILSQYAVKQLVLSPCEYRPILYAEIRKRYKVSYRCGLQIVTKIHPSESRIAILSEKDILVSSAKKIISDFSINEWVLIDNIDNFIDCNVEMSNEDLCMSNFYIFNRVIKSD